MRFSRPSTAALFALGLASLPLAGGCYRVSRPPPSLEAYTLSVGQPDPYDTADELTLLFEPTALGATRGRVRIVFGNRAVDAEYTRSDAVVTLASPATLRGGEPVGCDQLVETIVDSFALTASDDDDDGHADRLDGQVVFRVATTSAPTLVPVTASGTKAGPAIEHWVASSGTPLELYSMPTSPVAPPPGVFLNVPITSADGLRFDVDGKSVTPAYEVDSAGFIWALWLPRVPYPFGSTVSLVTSDVVDFAGRRIEAPSPFTFRTASISDGRCEEDPRTQSSDPNNPLLRTNFYGEPPLEGAQSCALFSNGGFTGRLAVPEGATELVLDAEFIYRPGSDPAPDPTPFLAVTIARGDVLVQRELWAPPPVTYPHQPKVGPGVQVSDRFTLRTPLPEGDAREISVAFDGTIPRWPPRFLPECVVPPVLENPHNLQPVWADLMRAE